ncbi:hypothetical protein PTTG_29135, partial [Puccinia triticina 1-1 BBBD Race 1]
GVVESEHDSGSVSDDADCSDSDNTNGHGSDSANNSDGECDNSDDGESLPPKRLSKDKEWFLPDLEDKFETYIDHGCTLDKQGYPIYPNGRTTFLRLPGEQITNFGTVGFSKTCSVNYRRNRTWKVTRYFCLGALVCDNPSKMRCRGLANKCKGRVSHQRCPDSVAIQFDHHLPTGWGILRQKGTHPHPWPKAKKPDRMAKEELKAEIKKHPKATALALKMGKASDPTADIDSVVAIHPAYINQDRLAYYRRTILAELGLAPDKLGDGVGDKFLLTMFGWAARVMWIISSSFMPQNEHFTFQTKWMSDRLMARDSDNQVYSGGLLSDVTYRYFENGYLLTTSIFCDELQRWIPIQLTWIRGLSEEYYKIHFATLFQQFLAASITPAKRDTLVRQVVDFSTAQVEGFVSAYLEVFRQGTRKEVGRMLKGCREHFRQSVTRVKRNRSLITVNQEEPFRKACMDLLEPATPDGQTHEQKVDHIRRHWWTVSDIEALLFPSREPRLEDTPDGLPDTTNGQESLHRTYYRLSDGRQCLMLGMIDLYKFVDMLERDWKALMEGVQISYGAGDKGQDVGVTMGLGKKRKRGTKYVNDGRPPDTTEELVGKKTGRPPQLRNFNKNLWAAYVPLWARGELNGSNTIRSTISRGQNSVFEAVRDKYPGEFIPGAFASCDRFLEVSLDPKLHKRAAYKELFSVKEQCEFTCQLNRETPQSHPDREHQTLHVLKVEPYMFHENNIPYSDVAKLINLWQSSGLISVSGLVCKLCTNPEPSSKPKPKKRAKLSKVSSEIAIVANHTNLAHYIIDQSKLEFNIKDHPAPLHLHFHIEFTGSTSDAHRLEFMATTNWPFKLTVGGHIYTLISRGYWKDNHYWCKVLRSANISADKGSLTAVWLHNDAANDGFAQQINRVPSSIAGADPFTSWVFYSRVWTPSEEEYVEKAIDRIKQDNPDASGDIPFKDLKSILNVSHNSTSIAHQEPPQAKKDSESESGESGIAEINKEADDILEEDQSFLVDHSANLDFLFLEDDPSEARKPEPSKARDPDESFLPDDSILTNQTVDQSEGRTQPQAAASLPKGAEEKQDSCQMAPSKAPLRLKLKVTAPKEPNPSPQGTRRSSRIRKVV